MYKTFACLCGDVGVITAVTVEVVSIDVVAGRRQTAVQLLQADPRVVVGDHVGVAVLGLVDVEARRLPGELTSRVDRLVLDSKQRRVVGFQSGHVSREVTDLHRRMT